LIVAQTDDLQGFDTTTASIRGARKLGFIPEAAPRLSQRPRLPQNLLTLRQSYTLKISRSSIVARSGGVIRRQERYRICQAVCIIQFECNQNAMTVVAPKCTYILGTAIQNSGTFNHPPRRKLCLFSGMVYPVSRRGRCVIKSSFHSIFQKELHQSSKSNMDG